MPDVSIVMPAYNAEEYIEMSIESVCAQTFEDWELLVTDDGSSDKTSEIIHKYSAINKRIKYYKNDCGKGPAAARNNSIRHAKGKYLAFLDADDIWRNNKLASQVDFMEKETLAFTYTGYNHIDTEGKFQKRIEVPISVCHADLMKCNVIATATVMIRRESFHDLSMPSFPRAQDYALWLKLLRQVGRAYSLGDPFSDYRVTPNIGNRRKIFALKYLYDIYTKQEGKSSVVTAALILRMYIHRLAKYW